MATNVQVEVLGVKDALRELNKIDKSARRKLTQRFKEIVKPSIEAARNLTPRREPMSGWARKWDPQAGRQSGSTGRSVFPYEPSKAVSAIQPYLSGRKPQEFAGQVRGLTAMGITWKSPSAVLFDQARNWETPQGRQMVETLTQRYGDPSRVMWRAWDQTEDDVIGNVQDLIEDLMRQVGQRIALDR